MFSIRQISDAQWEVVGPDGHEVLTSVATYAEGLAFLGGLLAFSRLQVDETAPTNATGVLPETWEDVDGICMSEPTGDGRDFSGCTWTARDPNESLMPLMLQTETEFGHMGAELAGFFTTIAGLGSATTPTAAGGFYDSESGRSARDLLLDGRRFGVSVDPGAVTMTWICTAEDADGWCTEEGAEFNDYEIIGLTMTPFPAFARAAIQLAGTANETPVEQAPPEPATAAPATVQAAASRAQLLAPPREWFETPEPEPGARFALGDLGDEWLVDQGQGRLAMPLTITGDGRIAGHLAVWGQCHIGYPEICVSPPESAAAYRHFHVGYTELADGEIIRTGTLVASCDHAAAGLMAEEARDHYAHNGLGWANVRASNGAYGPWVAGSLRPGVTREQLVVLRGGGLSGDWRGVDGNLELVAALAVTTPGFPIAAEALVASGMQQIPVPQARAYVVNGEQRSLVASGIVRRCPECARRASSRTPSEERGQDLASLRAALTGMSRSLATIERRTRHLVPQAVEHAQARLSNGR